MVVPRTKLYIEITSHHQLSFLMKKKMLVKSQINSQLHDDFIVLYVQSSHFASIYKLPTTERKSECEAIISSIYRTVLFANHRLNFQ